jgi:molecular chaperone GrpE (heat shock protein)
MDDTISPTPNGEPPPEPPAPPSGDVVAAPEQADANALRDLLEQTQRRVADLVAAVEAAAKQVTYLPMQIRNLGSKVEGLTTSVSDARLRALLLGVLSVYDIAEQMFRSTPANGAAGVDHRANYAVLRTQLKQLLASNGLEEIATDTAFDPQVHRAIQALPCSDPAQANRILDVVRAGFRTDQAVLRYAEVVVGQYETPPPEKS